MIGDYRPNNPWPHGTHAAARWELDAETTHARRLIVVAVHRLARRIGRWCRMSALSGWCQPGPHHSTPPHPSCTSDICPCHCHDTAPTAPGLAE